MAEGLKLILPPNAIKRCGGLLDLEYPGVELYENQPVGISPKFVRILGDGR